VDRRRFVQDLIVAGCSLAGIGATTVAARAAAPDVRVPVGVRLGYWGSPCEAVTYVAPHGGHFTRRHLTPTLTGFSDQAALIAALDAGTIDAASVNLAALLGPLERGSRVRVAAGLHSGCLRVLARDAVALDSLHDLGGTVIATDALHGPAMNLLSAILMRAGVDAQHGVTWTVYAPPDLEAALDAKTVTAVATADPLGFGLLRDRKAQPYLDGTDGNFSCGGDIAPGHHCFLALSGRFVERRPAAAAAVTRAYLDGTAAVARGVGPAAVAESTGPPDADVHDALGMLGSYTWSASTAIVVQEIEITAHDFRRAGLLARSTDPEDLAARAFADLVHG